MEYMFLCNNTNTSVLADIQPQVTLESSLFSTKIPDKTLYITHYIIFYSVKCGRSDDLSQYCNFVIIQIFNQ